MKTEEITNQNEETTLDNTQVNSDKVQNDNEGTNEVADENKNKSTFRRTATGVGAGILLGSLASFGFSSAANAATEEPENDGHVDNGDENNNPAWADDSVDIATSVSDDMTFSQAFAAARAEVGPGGAFEWQGNVYGTYTAEEWENMTPEEREEYNNHFSWSQHHSTSNSSEVDVVDETPEVEILGVVHDGETGANIGEIMVDEQEVFLIDVDGEGTFDYVVSDLNHDGQIAQDEFVDISADNISVHQFDNSLNEDPMYASNGGETDYLNDDVIS